MNLSAVDLNLLVAFEALYATRNVTLAAQRLHRAQPSVSNALARLRALFGDELFVRSRTGMQPTALADALMPEVAGALEQMRRALALGVPFDPARAERWEMTVACTDYADIVFMPHLMQLLRKLSPSLDVRVLALDRESIWQQLDDGVVDVAVGGHLQPPKRMLRHRLFDDEFVCIADRRNALVSGRRWGLAAYAALPHALFAPGSDGLRKGVVDVELARHQQTRRVAATFAHVVAVPFAVRGSDLVATVAARVVRQLAVPDVQVRALPAELGRLGFDVDMVWSPRTRGESSAMWFRNCLMRAASLLEVPAPVPAPPRRPH